MNWVAVIRHNKKKLGPREKQAVALFEHTHPFGPTGGLTLKKKKRRVGWRIPLRGSV